MYTSTWMYARNVHVERTFRKVTAKGQVCKDQILANEVAC